MMNRPSLCYRLLFLAAISLLLSACAAQIPARDSRQPPAQAAERSAAQGDYARAADLYMQAAQQQSDPQTRNALRLEAGVAAVRADRFDMAGQILASVQSQDLDARDYGRYQLARTEARIGGMSPAEALAQLPPPKSGTSPDIAARIWQRRAQLYFAQDDYIAGIHNLVQRGVWLVDEQAIRDNNEALYARALEAVSSGQGSSSVAAQKASATTRGWLQLAEIGRRDMSQGPALERVLSDWENRFPGHPATRHVLLEQFNYKPFSSAPIGVSGRPIALALPLSGDFAGASKAIREGFKLGHGATSPELLVYDATTLSAREILQKARTDRVSLIVGPLNKDKVRALAQLGSRIPTLALNQVDNVSAPPSFYQYALAPEDDARAAAVRAADQGWDRALALVPRGDWGNRILAAFRDAFRQRGGQLVDYASFDPEQYDHQQAIQSVLRSRSSADFVFLAAQPAHGRLVRSQLRFFKAGDLPVLATSHVYAGQVDTRADIDLNGVTFAGIPWLIGDSPELEAARRRVGASRGETAERYPRLFAMGMDARQLAELLIDGQLRPGQTVDGATGILEVQRDGRVRRHLAWARFVDGRPRLIAMPSRSTAPARVRRGRDADQPRPDAQTSPAGARRGVGPAAR